jgi:hypothetical protein
LELKFVYSNDYTNQTTGSQIAVFPYLETIAGKDFKVAFTEDVTVLEDLDTGSATTITLELPTGSIDVVTSVSGDEDNTVGFTYGGTTTTIDGQVNQSIQVGTVYYTFEVTNTSAVNFTRVRVGIDPAQTGSDALELDAGLLFVEEEDNADSDDNNAIIVPTGIDASTETDVDNSNIKFTAPDATDFISFDDSEYSGAIDTFGAYVVQDNSDSDQDFATITYPEEQMYAEVFISEIGATITPGLGGSGGQILPVKDKDVSAVSDKNLIVIGGSCVNEVAAAILGSAGTPLCTTAFTDATGVGEGQYILKSVESPYNEDKIAMLVAGYEKEQTLSAVALLKDGASTDIGEEIYPRLT